MPLYQLRILLQEDKVNEFARSLRSLCPVFLEDKGCLSYEAYQKIDKKNTFCIVGEFATDAAMAKHFNTRNFEVLVGAASVLGKSFEMITTKDLERGNMELARSKVVSKRNKHRSRN